jgi:hypothetical protein
LCFFQGGNDAGHFELTDTSDGVGQLRVSPVMLPAEFVGKWTEEQLPRIPRLKLIKPLDYDTEARQIDLIIEANVNECTP